MGIFSRFTGAVSKLFKRTKQKAVSAANDAFTFLFSFLSAPPRRQGKEWLQMYGTHPWFHAGIQRIAEAVSSYEPKLVKSVGSLERRVLTHPALDVLMKPNPEMTWENLVELYVIYRKVLGECFWLIERNGFGEPAEIWPIPPYWVLQTPTNSSPYFLISFPGGTFPLPPEQVVWMRKPDPTNPYDRGLGDALSIGDEVETDDLAAQFNKQFFYNSARPEVAITVPGNVTPTQAQEYEDRWAEKYQGFQKAFKVAILANGADVKTITETHSDMNFNDGRRSLRDIVLGALGIPLAVMGIVESINRANAEAGEYLFSKWVVHPLLKSLGSELNLRYLILFPRSEKLKFKFESAILENREQKLKEATQGMNLGAIMIDEWRESMGWDPLPDGNGQVFLLPQNRVVVRSYSERADLQIVPGSSPALPSPGNEEGTDEGTSD